MFEHGFPPYWSTLKKLIWLVGTGIAGGAKWITLTGSIVSFVAKKVASILGLTVTITPQQDLHGQDAPYPAGGKGNIFDGIVEIGGISTSSGGDIAQTDRQRTKNYIPVSENTDYYFYRSTAAAHSVYCYDSSKVLQSYHDLGTANGVFTTPEGTSFIRFIIRSTDLTDNVAVNYPSSITTYSPYSNICPIIGWTGATVERTGKNLFDISTAAFKKWRLDSNSFATLADSTSTITFSVEGDEVTISNTVAYCGIGVVIGAVDYDRIASVPSSIGGAVQFWSAYEDGATRISTGAISCTIPANTSGFLALRHDTTGSVTTKVQLEEGSTATDYEPYQGTTLSVDWTDEAGTVYDGALDVDNGILTVDMISVDISTLNFSISSPEQHIFRSDSLKTDIKPAASGYGLANALCSAFWQKAWNPISSSDNGAFGIATSESAAKGRVVFIDHRYSTVEDFIAGNQGVQLVYELAEPITIQLTPQQISTLAGENNIWSNASDSVSVTIPSNIIVT